MDTFAQKLQHYAGYKTHLIGKWDAGFATTAQLPINKGYDSFYGYLGKVISYFSKEGINDCQNLGDVDLWQDARPTLTSQVDGERYVEYDFADHFRARHSRGYHGRHSQRALLRLVCMSHALYTLSLKTGDIGAQCTVVAFAALSVDGARGQTRRRSLRQRY